MFFSDHGDLLGSHGLSGNSLPWEECIRIPFIVGMVGGRNSMQVGRSDALPNHVDIAPTTLGLCGNWLLYDTAGDPYEQANLVYWHDHQEAKQRCHRRLERWTGETGDAFELPDIDLEGAAGCWPAR